LFGLEVQGMKFHQEHYIHTGVSKFCTKCMPSHNPLRCPPEFYVKACKCPAEELHEVQWIMPQLQGSAIMHSKLMLFRFPGFVRIVVSSLNLCDRQWLDAGDSFWWADVPLIPNASQKAEPFMQAPLTDTLNQWGLEHSWVEILRFCDWASLQEQKSRIRMITSVPHPVADKIEYGMKALHSALKSLPKFPPSAKCPVYIQVWSLGGASNSWYSDLSRVLTQERISELGQLVDWKSDHVRFIFQEMGRGANWQEAKVEQCANENFVRSILNMQERRPPSIEIKKALWDEQDSCLLGPRAGARRVPWGWHSKVMTREYPRGYCKNPGCERAHGWRYIGSHNCSRASWGWSYFDRSSKQFVMDAPSNWEMGVILTSHPALREDEDCGKDLSRIAPLPFVREKLTRSHPHR